ncbi:MAG TPA: DUF1569 domain-containing protein [Gemmatimonadales bacterium]|nr:DUF1569 domain-containing protein [Gemmatimonadales bacterium]
MPHLADGLRLALGELHRPSRAPHPLKAAVRRLLAIYLLPWPKGKIEAPAGAFTTPSAGWDADRAQVVALVERLAAATASQVAPVHPHFGRMSLGDWGVLQYRHMDHHLRQFGV